MQHGAGNQGSLWRGWYRDAVELRTKLLFWLLVREEEPSRRGPLVDFNYKRIHMKQLSRAINDGCSVTSMPSGRWLFSSNLSNIFAFAFGGREREPETVFLL